MARTKLDRPVLWVPGTRDVRVDPRNEPGPWHPGQKHVWRRGYFDVPAETSEEAVQNAADRYKRKYGEWLERPENGGWTVLGFDGPHRDNGVVARGVVDSDRKRYVLWAKVTRRPVVVNIEVPDEDVPLYQRAGYQLRRKGLWRSRGPISARTA